MVLKFLSVPVHNLLILLLNYQPNIMSTGKSTYKAMAKEAISALKDRTGSSLLAIKSYISSKYSDLTLRPHYLRAALKKGVTDGAFVMVKASYKLSAAAKKSAPKKKAVPKKTAPKKAAAVKPKKAAAKKTSPKKAAVKKTTPKKAVAKKTAPKKASPKKTTPKKAVAKKTAVAKNK